MTLRAKTLFALSITLLGLVILLYLLLSALLMDNYTALDDQQTLQHVQRVVNALERELEGMKRTADDWAAWNETRDFVQGTYPAYVTNNLIIETFTNLRLNLMLFYDSSGQMVFARAVDLDREQEVPVMPEMRQYIAAYGSLLQHNDPTSGKVGVIMLPQTPMLTVIYPVSSNTYGPVVGTLVLGRYLNAAETEYLSTLTDVTVSFYRWDSRHLPADVQRARSTLSTGVPITIEALTEQIVAGYTHYPDINNQPGLLLRIETSRAVYAQGQASLFYLLIAVLISGLVFVLVTLLIIERLVLSRLMQLSTDVARIHDIPGARLTVTRQDELGNLATVMNDALTALEDSYQQQQQINNMLLNSRNLLRTIFDTINDGLLLLDDQGRVLAVNQAMATILGHTPVELIDISWTQICREPFPCGGDAHGLFSAQWVLDTLHDGQARQHRAHIFCSDKTTRVFDMQALPIYQADEDHRDQQHSHTYIVSQVVLHVVDVTEQRHMEMLMLENERLTASRRLSQIVAHEVNSPLQTILFLLETLQATAPQAQQEFLTVAQHEIERIGKILHQLKDLYHRSPQSPAPIDINTLIERVLLLTSGTLQKHDIHVERYLAADLPPLLACGDQVMQTLLNLVLNAIDSMPQGGLLHIATRLVEAEEHPAMAGHLQDCSHVLVIEVTDTGMGIDAAVQDRIFDSFFTTKERGSGLGLAVSQKIIEEHQGHIAVQSSLETGTTFTIHLPMMTMREP